MDFCSKCGLNNTLCCVTCRSLYFNQTVGVAAEERCSNSKGCHTCNSMLFDLKTVAAFYCR